MGMNLNDAEFFKKLRSTFKIEAHEHLRTISLSLFELEKASIQEDKKTLIETIHREFHSLKGASRAVNIKEIESLCHVLENIFSKIKKEILQLNTEMFDDFNQAIDAMEDILSLQDGKEKDISKIMDKLRKIEVGNLQESKETKGNPIRTKHEENIKVSIPVNSNVNIKFKDMKPSKEERNKIIRVSKDKLDSLLLQGEEMLYAKLSAMQRSKEIKEMKVLFDLWKKEKKDTLLKTLEKSIEDLVKSAEYEEKTIGNLTDTFMEDIKDMMLLPFSSITEMFPKMVRDLSRNMEKEIEFISSGIDIEMDRRILEEIKDPLMHIIRNSIDHGIEKKEQRKVSGKNLKGRICLRIAQESSDRVKIEISDDGAGINIDKIKDKVIKNKIVTEEQVNKMDEESIQMLIFKSGLSTSDIITDISGRGLGLAIVQEKVKKMEGNLRIKSEKGRGTTFTMILPITISTHRGIIVKAGEQDFVIPTGKVEKVVSIKREEIQVVENRETILLDGYIIPIVQLKDILEIQNTKEEESSRDVVSILIINDMENKIGFSVDEIIIEQEVLVKRFNKQLKRIRNISGATILGSEEVVPILDVQDLIKSSLKYSYKSLNPINKGEKEEVKKQSIIVVEDSITSRTLLKNILEINGYYVKTAVDGLQGWKMIKSEEFDLVITDVEMPEMNGFELTTKIRSDEGVSEIPVILVTSLESREDRERGIDVGASAYIVKSDFQQSNLLEIIKRLI